MVLTRSDVKTIPTFCAMCGPGTACGVWCHVKDGRLMSVEGMKESPVNKGKLCPRAFASTQWLYSPQRLKYPLKRVGERGEGKFERITWDEALDTTAKELVRVRETYGPASIVYAAGGGDI